MIKRGREVKRATDARSKRKQQQTGHQPGAERGRGVDSSEICVLIFHTSGQITYELHDTVIYRGKNGSDPSREIVRITTVKSVDP